MSVKGEVRAGLQGAGSAQQAEAQIYASSPPRHTHRSNLLLSEATSPFSLACQQNEEHIHTHSASPMATPTFPQQN